MSSKILGSDSELKIWHPETMVGVIVLNPPNICEEQWKQLNQKPVDYRSIEEHKGRVLETLPDLEVL